MNKFVLLGAVASIFTASAAAAAPNLGDTVTCVGQGFACSQPTATVGAGVEFTGNFSGTPYLNFNFSTNLLTISNIIGNFGTGATFVDTFTDPLNPFTQATFTGASGVTGFSQSKITLTNGALSINLNSVQFGAAGSTIQIALAGGAVPEPATWAMMIGGFGLVGGTMRRRKTSIAFA